jgi:DNA-binding transcriptional ArsR family regulator
MLQTSIAALADPNRFRIVELLRTGPRPVNDIAGALRLNQPQVSKHLKVLKDAGWVDVEARAQQRVYELQPEPLRELAGWLERCDIVKYGGLHASAGDARAVLDGARTLVMTTTRAPGRAATTSEAA